MLGYIKKLKNRIRELEEELAQRPPSQDAHYLQTQNEVIYRKYNAYRESARSLCVEVRKYGYGARAVAKHEYRTRNL